MSHRGLSVALGVAVLLLPGAPAHTGTTPGTRAESLHYSVGWRGIIGARAHLVIDAPAPDTVRYTADVENTMLLALVFRIKDRFQALADAVDGRTRSTYLWQNENGRRRYREESFFESQVVATERWTGGERTLAVPVARRPADPLGLLAWLRQQELTQGRALNAEVFANNRVFDAHVVVQGAEPVRAAGRRWDALRVRATFHRNGEQVEGVHGTFWLSNDERRIPLKVTADTTYGPVTGTLVDFAP